MDSPYLKRATLQNLIQRQYAWNEVEEICEKMPDMIQGTIFTNGNTALHEICVIGSAPNMTVKKVMNVWRNATLHRNKYGDTPLHVAARNAQRSSSRVYLLVHCACGESKIGIENSSSTEVITGSDANKLGTTLPKDVSLALSYANKEGHTPLGVACTFGTACLPVLKLLLHKYPDALKHKDIYGHTPIESMWCAFHSNIVGASALRTYLRGEGKVNSVTVTNDERVHVMSRVMKKFWIKFRYCVVQSYQLHHDVSSNFFHLQEDIGGMIHLNKMEDFEFHTSNDMFLHSILSHRINRGLDKLVQIALTKEPDLGLQVNQDGNTPLHIVSSRKLLREAMFQKSDDDYFEIITTTKAQSYIIGLLLDRCKESAKIKNNEGRYPLHTVMDDYYCLYSGVKYGIQKGAWHNVMISRIMESHIDALDLHDTSSTSLHTYLYPFMIPALYGDIEMTYEMLRQKPTVLGVRMGVLSRAGQFEKGF